MKHRFATTVALAAVAILGVTADASALAVSATSQLLGATATNLTLSNDQFLSDVSVPGQSGFDVGSTLASFSLTTSSGPGTSSFASIDNTFAPLPSTGAGAIGKGQGASTVLWTFDWTATSTGTASIDFDWLNSITLTGLDAPAGDTAYVSASFQAIVDGTSTQVQALEFFNTVTGNGNQFSIDPLTLSFAVVAGQTGTISVTLASNAGASAVPLPAALPLLASGLLGLLGAGRRRRREAALAA